jgi:branched-chain amino acid transport system permease protein
VTGVRDNEIVASSFGVNPARVKELLFGVSSAIGGAAGACYVATVGYVAPDAFPLHLSVVLLIACVVGGLRTVGGAVVAGLFIVYAPLMIDSFIGQAFADVVYGVIVILVLLVAPGGVAGEWQHRRARRVLSGTTGPSPDLQEGEK